MHSSGGGDGGGPSICRVADVATPSAAHDAQAISDPVALA